MARLFSIKKFAPGAFGLLCAVLLILLYIASDQVLVASQPPALAWQSANQGLIPHAPVTAIAVDPDDPQVLYAGVYASDSLYISKDGGVTWQRAGRGVAGQPVFALLFDPQHANTLWAGTADGLYRGQRVATLSDWDWQRVKEWPAAVAVYSLYAAGDNRLYAAGDHTALWTLSPDGQWQPRTALPEDAGAILSVAAASEGLLLAGTDGAGLYVSRDHGHSWTIVAEIGETFVAALWVSPWDASLLLARTRAGLFRSTDGAITWQRTAVELEERVDAIAAGAADRSIYLGLGSGGILRSADQGATWQAWGEGVGRDGLFYALLGSGEQGGGTFFAGTQHGFYRSQDGALTWEVSAGLGTYRVTALAQAADATLYLGKEDGVYVSTDQGTSWQPRSSGLPARAVLSLAISPHNERVLYAATEGDGIYRSQDGGSTWSQYAWPGYIIADVLPDPDLPQRVYARVAYERIYVSDDDGATWTARWDSMPPTTEIMSLAVSPHDGDMLYAGAATELYRSRNRAVDWQRIGGELAGQSVFLVSMDVDSPEIIYAGATKGTYRSEDAGATWQPWGTGLEDITVTALAMDPLNPGVAYVGTKHRGIYASYTGGQTWHPASIEEKDHTVHALQVSSDGHWLYAATDRGFQRTSLLEAPTSRKYAPPGRTHFQEVPASWRPDLRAPRYGIHTLSADERTLPLVQAVGADTVVQLFPWWEIEPTKEQFIWQGADEAVAGAEYYGLNLVVRLDKHPEWANAKSPGPGQSPVDLVEYSHWVRRVVERYKHRVHAYIIWNEPNLALEWSGLPPDPQAYAELLKVAYAAVKEIDPDALVVSAGLAPTNTQNDEAMDDRLFLEALYEHGADDYFDVLGVHAYGFGYPPDDPRGAHDGLNLARTADLRDIMLRHGDGDKPVWITEMGWTTQGNEHSAWQEVTRQQQADYLRAALLGIRRDWPWVDLITIWNLGGEDNPDWGGYSLLEANGTPRPGYLALQSYLAGQGHGTLHADAPASVAPLDTPHRYQVLAPDAIIHLGDNRLPAPWVPLYQDRNPSPQWRGTVYVHEPGEGSWQLTFRVMQSNFWSNRVWVNGQVLPEPLPLADFSKSWVSHTLTVPPGLLRPGPNEIRVTLGHATPLIQDKGFAYDKLQFKDLVLWK